MVGHSAVFLPSGHGTMWDLPVSARLTDLLSQAWADANQLHRLLLAESGLLPADFDPKLPFACIYETGCDSVCPLKTAALLRAGIDCHARTKVR